MRRSESQRSALSSRVRRLAASRWRRLPCRCWSAASCPSRGPDAGLDIPDGYRAGPRKPDKALPVGPVVARLSLQAAHRSGRGGADLQPRHRRGGRAHRAGRRAVAHRGRAAAAGDRSQRQRDALAGLAVDRQRFGGQAALPSASTYATSLSASYETRLLGQEPRRAARRRGNRGRKPLRSRGGGAHHGGRASPTVYFQVLAATDRLRIARDNLAAATRVFNLIKERFDVGTASALDVAQQEALVNQVRAAIPPLRAAAGGRTSRRLPC